MEIRTHLSGLNPILESPDLSFRGLNAPGVVIDLISPPPRGRASLKKGDNPRSIKPERDCVSLAPLYVATKGMVLR